MWNNISKPNSSNYTNVAKPTGLFTIGVGYATGVLGPPTYSDSFTITAWNNLNKPTTSAWVNINKPT